MQEKDLRPLNTEITEARRIIMRDVVAAKGVTERTCPIPFAVFAGETDNIVPPASAQDVFPEVSVLPGDHNGIIRPDSAEHLTYVALRRHLVLSLAAAEPPSTPGGDTPGKAPGSPREPSPDAPPSPGGTDAEAPQAPPTNGIPRLTARAARVLGGGHTTGIHLARFTADAGRLATFAARRPTALLWDLSGPRPAGGTFLKARCLASGPNYREYRRLVTDAVFSPDGTMLVTAVDMRLGPEQFRGKKVRLWDPATRWSIGEPLRVTNMAVVSALAFSPMNDLLAVAMAAGPIRLWNPRQRRMIRALRPGAQSDVMAFSPDGRTLAATEQRGTLIRLWDVESGKSTAQPLVGHSVFVRGIVFSADGSLLATRSDDRTVRVRDTREGAMVALLRTEPRAFVTAFAFACGGHHLLTALADGRIVGWDARTGARQGEDLRVDGDVADMVFTPAGHLLAVTGGAAPMLYEWEPAAEGTV
ncbi:WD-repeat protein [Streptomyces sp. SPB074]|nr:WD-repeat protein [Streptomyces sp. SPB074]EDY46832.2 WD-repeat protein [Streptomyces sp. SPB074]